MIDSIRKELENNIKTAILSVVVDGYDDLTDNVRNSLVYEEQTDFTLRFHDSLYHKQTNAKCDITILFIEGNIETDVVQHPVMLTCDCDEPYKSILFKALSKMSFNLNETLVDLSYDEPKYDAQSNELKETYRWFFNTPQYAGKFKDVGINQRVGISLNLSLIKFDNILDIEYLKIDNEQIRFLNFVMSYAVDTNSTGALTSSAVSLVGETATSNYTFTAVPKNTTFFNNCISKMIDCNDANKKWSIKLKHKNGNEKTFNAIITSATYTKQNSGFPTMQITLGRGD